MESKLIAAFLCLAVVGLSEGANPVITGGNTQTQYMGSTTAASGTAFYVISNIAAHFTLGGTDASYFNVAPTTGGTAATIGTVTLKAAQDCAAKSSYSLTVTAADGSSAPDTTDVTVTLLVYGCSSGSPAITGSLTAMMCMIFMLVKKLA